MCGRTACTLEPDEICRACSRKGKITNRNLEEPTWMTHPGNKSYTPSVNIAPSCYTPILFRSAIEGKKRDRNGAAKDKSDSYKIMPMRWGLIPSFFKGASTSEFNFKTNNCRLEGIEEKKMYKPSLVKGQRCVVLCDGFYEWQTAKNSQNKQPFIIHAPQQNGIEIWNRKKLDETEIWSETDGWKGLNLLMMAGLYSYWISPEHEEIYSYTVITMESGDNFSWLHHRFPAILETLDDVDNWLQDGSYQERLNQLTTKVKFSWYEVSKLVNNSRNQDPAIINPASKEEKKVEETKSQKIMSSWLKTAKSEPTTKQQKGQPKGILKFFSKV